MKKSARVTRQQIFDALEASQKIAKNLQSTVDKSLALVKKWEKIAADKDARIAALELELSNWKFDELVRMALRDTKPASNAVQ